MDRPQQQTTTTTTTKQPQISARLSFAFSMPLAVVAIVTFLYVSNEVL